MGSIDDSACLRVCLSGRPGCQNFRTKFSFTVKMGVSVVEGLAHPGLQHYTMLVERTKTKLPRPVSSSSSLDEVTCATRTVALNGTPGCPSAPSEDTVLLSVWNP